MKSRIPIFRIFEKSNFPFFSASLRPAETYYYDCAQRTYSVFHVALTDFEGKFHNLWLIADSIANVFQVQYEGTFDTQIESLECITPYLYSRGICQESQSPSIQIPLSGHSIDISKQTSLHLICQIFHTYLPTVYPL